MSNTFSGNTYYGRATDTLTIASGASVSGSLNLENATIAGFVMPAAWTSADLTIEVSLDGSNWLGVVYDSSATQCNTFTTPAADEAYALDVRAMAPYQYVRIRSGTTAAAVNQGADRDVVVVSRLIA